ncbi:MAG: PH domain-containing protein [Phycisphaerales bacterium]|nr:PH domain-containing protein [Phycisphaerales bacterium]
MKLGPNEEVLRTATFDKMGIIKYHWTLLALLSLLLVTIPLTLILAVIYYVVLDRVISSWECVLTSRALHVKKGVFNKSEKTVPLEKITDLQMVQGPIMRMFKLHRISVETAGQSGPGSLISLIGIQDTEEFRKDVLDQRDRMSKGGAAAGMERGDGSSLEQSPQVLMEIKDTLGRMERLLNELVESTRK